MIVKGVKISELELRDKLTGEELIPFQDQLSNGKMDMKSIIDYFEEMSDQEVNLQSLVNIKQYVSNSKELEFVSSNVGDVYFNTGDKKLYVYQEDGTYATTDPSKYRMYVRLDKDEYGRTNIIHRWDGNNMTVISERLFIGEEEGTAYEGSKGKQVRDDLDALNATIDKYPAKLVSGILDPNYSGSSVDLRYSFYDRISDTNSTGTKTVNCASQSNAGFMAAADKVKIDKITTDGDGTRYLADNGTYKLIQGGGSGDSGTFVLETAAADSLTDTEYNDLKDAIEANKIIIADLGLTLGIVAQIYQPCFAATYDSGSNRIVLSLTQTTGTVSSSEDTRRLVVCDIIISGSTGHSVSRDNYNLVNENQVLTFGNTKEYTPTTPYSPATRKYVDDNRYGKTFVVSSVNSFLTNRKETGSAAETATNNIFGSKESFRAVVDDIISNHTRYYIHVDGDANNCVELGCVNAWKNADSSMYQLHFIITYYTGSTLYTKRISINSDSSADSAFIEIADLVNSDNINVMTKKTTSEYNSLSKNDNTAYFVVD